MTDRNSLAERTFDVRGQDDVGNDTIDDDHNPNEEEEEDDDDKKPPASLPSFEEPLAMQERFDQDDDVPAVEGLGGSLQSSLLNSSESDEDRKRSASELDDHPFHGELFAEPDEQFDAAAAAVQREQEQQQQQQEHAHQGNAKRPRLLRVRSPHPPYHHAASASGSDRDRDRDRRPFVEHRVSMTLGTHGYHYGMGTPPTGYYRSTIHSNMASPAPMQAPSLAMPGYAARSPMRQPPPPPPLASQPAPSPIVSSSAFGERSQQHSSRYSAAPSPHSYQPSQQQAPPPHRFMHHHSYDEQPSPGGYAYASPAHHPHHHHHQHPPHAYAPAWSASPSYAYPPYAAAQHAGESPRGGYDYHHSQPEPPLPPPPPLEGAAAQRPPAAAAAAALAQLPDRIPRGIPHGPSPEELEEARTQRARAALNTWYQRYEELIQYKRQNGHCNVPQKYEPNQQLGIWVNKQRMEKKAYDEPGKASSMTEHKIQALELIGFAWAKRKGEAAWMEKYEELKEYKRIHGNCEVPTKFRENPALGRWVSTQRSNYRLRVDNDDKSKLTDEKFDLLEQLGFRWRMMNSNGS